MGIFAQDQWTVKRLTAELRRAHRLPEGDRRPAGHRGRSVHAGAQLRRHRQRAELEGLQSARRRGVRPVRQRQDGAQGAASAATSSPTATRSRARSTRCSRRSTRTTRTWLSDPAGQLDPRLDCDLPNPDCANGSCGALATPAFGGTPVVTTTYDPAIVTGWGVRPYNWETQPASSSRWRRACRSTPATRAAGSATSSPRRTPR